MHSWNVPAGIPGGWTGSLRSSDRKCVLREGGEREREGGDVSCWFSPHVLTPCSFWVLFTPTMHTYQYANAAGHIHPC